MNLQLKRNQFRLYGIFGDLLDESSNPVCVTLEHSYLDEETDCYLPKIPCGTYTCVRGSHRLASMANPFETFEITNVPGHSNILFHCGNTNSDSEGCVLLGSQLNALGVSESRKAFDHFMQVQSGCDSFVLVVS